MEAARMRKKNKKPLRRKIVLRLPDLDHAKSSVLNSLSSPSSRRNYKFAMEQFITWYCSEPRLALNRTVVLRFRLHLESLGLAAGTINQRLAATLRMELDHLAPHDLRRTCAKLCHVNGGELEQIQFLLGHASVLTTERYLGCKQNLEEPVNDRFGCLFSRTLDSR
jgi:Phage integrase family